MSVPVSLVATIGLVSAANLALRRGMAGAGAPRSIGALLGAALRSPFVLGGGALYALSMATWIWTLRTFPVSRAYPAYVGGSFVLVLAGSRIFLGERIGLRRLVGAAAILGGIALEVLG